MAQAKKKEDIQAHYDFSNAKRGKYAKKYAAGTNLVALDPDIAKIFKDASSVNETLRAIVKIILPRKKQAA